MIHPVSHYDHNEVDRYIAEARVLRSREIARLMGALFRAPRRLLRAAKTRNAEPDSGQPAASNA